jgi:hypothetical protein
MHPFWGTAMAVPAELGSSVAVAAVHDEPQVHPAPPLQAAPEVFTQLKLPLQCESCKHAPPLLLVEQLPALHVLPLTHPFAAPHVLPG